MRRCNVLSIGYQLALMELEKVGKGVDQVLRSSGKPSMLQVVDDVLLRVTRLEEKEKSAILRVFVHESGSVAKQTWVAETFHTLFTRLAQTKSVLSVELLTAALESCLTLKYSKYAEMLMMQLLAELRRGREGKVVGVNHTALLNELLSKLSGEYDEPKVERAKNIVSRAFGVGIMADATTVSLLLAHAGKTRCPRVIDTTKTAITTGTLCDFPEVETTPMYYLSLLSAYTQVRDTSDSHQNITRTLVELTQHNIPVMAAHYNLLISSYIRAADSLGFDIIEKYCKKRETAACDVLRLSCVVGTDVATLETQHAAVCSLDWSDVKCHALLEYSLMLTKREADLDKVSAVTGSLEIYNEKISEKTKARGLVKVLEVLAEVGDVKHLEDLLSCEAVSHKDVLLRGYRNARERAERMLFPIHWVMEGHTSEAPLMDVPAIIPSPVVPPPPVSPVALSLGKIPAPATTTTTTTTATPPKTFSPSRKGSAPTGIYTAAIRVGPDGQPLTRKRHPINQGHV